MVVIMNTTKIQLDLLKDVSNKKGYNWFIEVIDDDVIVLTNYQAYKINSTDFFLNIKKLIDNGVRNSTMTKHILDDCKYTKPLTKTPIKRVMGKYTCIELKLGEESIYVDEALLKNYNKSMEFEGTHGKAPVYIYEGESLVGFVLPIREV